MSKSPVPNRDLLHLRVGQPLAADCSLLAAREAIRQLMYQYCRGVDRREWAAVEACFHADALDDHCGGVLRTPAELVSWLSKRHLRTTSSFHMVMNVAFLIEDFDQVRTESLCWARQRYRAGTGDRHLEVACRYLDRLEFRDGIWAIGHRQVVYEWLEDCAATSPQVPPGIAGDVSRRDREDPVFAFLAR